MFIMIVIIGNATEFVKRKNITSLIGIIIYRQSAKLFGDGLT